MSSTRKMPVRINESKRRTFPGEHLLPVMSDLPRVGFVSAKTAKAYSRGAIVFLGKEVTPEMMLDRYCKTARGSINRDSCLRRLAAYCDALQELKIGNVVTATYGPDGLPILHVEEKYFLSKPDSKLP